VICLLPAVGIAQEDMVVQPAKREVTLTGYTRSKTTVTLSSEVAGKIIELNYDVGMTIGEAPFTRIDPTFVDLQIQSTLLSINQLKITQERRKSRTAYLEKEFRRIENLFQRGSTAESKKDTAEEDLQQARLEVEATSVEIAKLTTQLQELKERKQRHTVFAPRGWIVVDKHIETGEVVNTNSPLGQVADYEHLVVPFSVSADELAAIKRLPETFEVILEGKPATAFVNWINPEFNEKTRKLAIELEIGEFDGNKRGGLTCRLSLQIQTEGLLVPRQAVISRYENPRVFLKSSGEEVKILVMGEAGDQLLIANNPLLAPGVELIGQGSQAMEPIKGP
jgi:multidrug efflux pump subunit AcrA (membrane-fusion protein)